MNFTIKFKKVILHLLILFISFYSINSQISSSDFSIEKWSVFVIVTVFIAFYFHTFLLFPILLKKVEVKKYIILTFIGLLIVGVLLQWFEAMRSSLITINLDGTPASPFDFFLSKNWITQGFFVLIVSFLPFTLLSFAFYLLFANREHRKELFESKFTEPILNLIGVGLIFFFILVNSKPQETKMFFVALISILVFYFNVFYLSSSIFKKKKNKRYLIINLLLFVMFYGVVLIIIHGGFRNTINEWQLNSVFIIGIGFLLIIFTSFIYADFRNKIKNKNLELESKDSELQLLKSQVNPHFLFNTLNTLYATALEEKAEKTAESTAKLASLIRYMQNDINKDFIPLINEINYLEDYIVIQKLRCAIEPEVKTTFKSITNQIISPGLLIPFIENAFKYGIDPSKKSELTISIICDESNIHFTCVNTYDENFKIHKTEAGFGIGINNAKQRLALVYPKKHSFEILKENNTFSVKLIIPITNI